MKTPDQLEEVITHLIIQEKIEMDSDNTRRMERIKILCGEYFKQTGNHYRFPTAEGAGYDMQA